MTIEAASVLEQLAALIEQRNEIDARIGAIIGRPAMPGHIGEFVASHVFGIALETSATTAGHDGRFAAGPLAGKTVNVKAYGKRENMLDINLCHVPDYYLVLTGPKATSATSKGRTRPWVISEVFLFDASALIELLRSRQTKIGIATSVPSAEWEKARIFPVSPDAPLKLPEEPVRLLRLFQGGGDGSA